jgi:hypothetical protein
MGAVAETPDFIAMVKKRPGRTIRSGRRGRKPQREQPN